MGSEAFVGDVLAGFGEALEPLEQAISSTPAFTAFLAELGWTLDPTDDHSNALGKFGAVATDIQALTQAIQTYRALPANANTFMSMQAITGIGAAIAQAAADIVALANTASAGLPAPLDDAAFWESLAEEVLELLLYEYLRVHRPGVFGVLRFLGIAVREPILPTAARAGYARRGFDWDNLAKAATDPRQLFTDVYKWGGAFEHQAFMDNVLTLASGFGAPAFPNIPTDALLDMYYDPDAPVRRELVEIRAPLYWAMVTGGGGMASVELSLVMLPIPAIGDHTGDPVGFTLTPALTGEASETVKLTESVDLVLKGKLDSIGVLRIDVRPTGVDFASSPGGTSIDLSAAIVAHPSPAWVLIGSADSTRLELSKIHAAVEVVGPVTDLEAIIAAALDAGQLVLDFGEGDGFLSKIFGSEPQTIAFAVGGQWSSKTGFAFSGKVRLEITLPLHQTILGVITLDSIFISIGVSAGTGQPTTVTAVVALTASAKIGPIAASVSKVGMKANIEPLPAGQHGNLGDLAIKFGFKLPDGAGLSLNAGPVTGGGYLFIDEDKGLYAGIIQLQFQQIGLTCIGLLNTKMPDGSRGFSLLIIITAKFPPIQLGYGFVLTGAGGILGINRTVVVEALRAGVKNKTLDAIMFPADPIRDAPQIISGLSAAFPPAQGHFIFGPMIRIGWGSPPIITIAIGIALELPSPIRLIIMGKVQLALPDEKDPVLLLKLQILGIIDFDKGEASVDASLQDSKLACFQITGDIAMRANWSSSPTFMFSAGGYHPRFTPPPSFPKLDRLGISLATGDNPRLRLECYMAVTSNTAQFGAHLDAYASMDFGSIIGKFTVAAWFSFDALFQFVPFAMIAELHAGASLKRNDENLFLVSLDITLTGPEPWHAWGEARFEFFGKHSLGFDKTIGEAPPPKELPRVDLLPDLVAAVALKESWSAQLPPTSSMLVYLRQFSSQDVLAHPLGSIGFHQRVVPLNVEISKAGNAEPVTRRFSVGLTVGGNAPQPAPTPLQDDFAAAQFFAMSDDEKLARPSFERMEAGLQFEAGGLTHSNSVTTTTFEYETSIVDVPLRTVKRLPTRYRMEEGKLLALAGSGAAAFAPVRATGSERFAGPALGIAVSDQRYSLASRDDLTGVDGAAGLSYSEALDAGRARSGGRTQVVRSSEVVA
jgi:hypothetical protein